MQDSNGDTDREQTYRHGGEEGKEGGVYGESNMETYISTCKIANGNLLYDSGNSNWGSVTTQRGGLAWEGDSRWRFKREGTYVHLWLIHVDVWEKPTQYCKAVILLLKKDKLKNNMK